MAEVNCAINHLPNLSPNWNVYELLPFNGLFNGPSKKLFGKTTGFQYKKLIFPRSKPREYFLIQI